MFRQWWNSRGGRLMTHTITWNCAYAVKTRSGIEYGTTSVDAMTETSAVVKINKKILDEKDDSYNRIVNIIINEDYLATTDHYDEYEIKDIISKTKSKKR